MRPIDADALKEKAWDADTRCGFVQVVDVGDIDAAPTIDSVPLGAYEQARWERDMAISQLAKIGKSLCEKMDDVARVVRCAECISFYTEGDGFGICQLHEMTRREEHFCSDGERSEE